MIHTHTLLGACLLLASSYVSATCDLSEHPPPSCKSDDWMSGPNPTCSLHTIELDPDGGHRYAVVTFPPTWSLGQASNQSYPLLLSFHGRNRDAAEQQILTGFSDPQNNINAIVAYPQGTCDKAREWQGDPRTPTEVDDIAFITSLISLIEKKPWGVDPSRIYATGKSNGGGFLNLLACDPTLSETIAAFAAASGAFYVDGTDGLKLPKCLPSNKNRAIPFMEFHGTGDCTIRYDGGKVDECKGPGVTRAVYNSVMKYWGGQSGCAPKDPVTLDCGIEQYSWTCNGIAENVVHYKIPDLGHVWPSYTVNDDCQEPVSKPQTRHCPASTCPTCIDATQTMWKWLQKFTLTRESSPLKVQAPPENEL